MLHIDAVPAFQDNYLWLIHRPDETAAWVVDPGDAGPVLAALAEKQLELGGILVTHHHPDHIGGVAALTARYPVPVYGPASIPGDCVTHPVAEGDEVVVLGHRFRVLETPGHTLDHIAYFLDATESTGPTLFCGDTLFAGGCGRVFEGTHPMMHASLQKLAALPPATRIYCAHEYTLANLAFAIAVEPANAALAQRLDADRARRAQGRPTVPSTLAMERETNPFLRGAESEVQQAASEHAGQMVESAEQAFAVLRTWKDEFRG